MNRPKVSIVVALGTDRVIGNKNQLLWHLPEDLKRFKTLTVGHPVIMGRKTFESIVSILGKPLPNRTSIVVTRDKNYSHEGAVIAHSLDEALKEAAELDTDEVIIGGGGNLWEQALPYVDMLYLTLVDDAPEGDAYFPEYEDAFEEIGREESKEENGIRYQWVNYRRKEI